MSAEPLLTVENVSLTIGGYLIPVSYTHLDVYKRQPRYNGTCIYPRERSIRPRCPLQTPADNDTLHPACILTKRISRYGAQG